MAATALGITTPLVPTGFLVMPVAMVLTAILEQSGYLKELVASSDPQDETRVENLAELESVAREFDLDAAQGRQALERARDDEAMLPTLRLACTLPPL